MHDGTKTTIERAIELARCGTCANIEEIRLNLSHEGYESVNPTLAGLAVKKQLRAMIDNNMIAKPRSVKQRK